MFDWLMDLFDSIIDRFSGIEINGKAAAVTIVFSVLMWMLMLKTPMWVNSEYFKGWRLWFMLGATPMLSYGISSIMLKD